MQTHLKLGSTGLVLAVLLGIGSCDDAVLVGGDPEDSSDETGWGPGNEESSDIKVPQASGGTAVFDSFNRSDSQTSLGTADSGRTWVVATPGAVFGLSAGRARLVSTTNTASSDNFAVVPALANLSVKVTLATVGQYSGLTFRFTNPSNCWKLSADTSSSRYYLAKIVGGVQTFPAQIAVAPASGDVLEVSAQGTTIKVYVNGQLKATVTDASHQTATSAGLLASSKLVARFDDFSAVEPSSPPSSPPPPGTTRTADLWPFASTSPWNMSLSVDAQYRSSTPLNAYALGANSANWSAPVYRAKSSDPAVWVTDRGDYYHVNVPMNVRMPSNADGALPDLCSGCGYSDGVMVLIHPNGRHLSEFFRYDLDDHKTSGHFTSCPASACPGVTEVNPELDLVSGTGWNYTVGAWKNITASGASWVGGLIRKWELEATNVDSIRHAIPLALLDAQFYNCDCHSNCGSSQTKCYMWPAVSSDGGGPGNYSGGDSYLRMGALVALDWNVDINSLGLSARGKKVAWALKYFGAYVRDRSGRFVTFLETDAQAYQSEVDADLAKLRGNLRIIANNGPQSVGGGSASSQRRTTLAPTPVAVPK